MNGLTFAPPWSDEAIVAWLDGEMNAADAERFAQQLEHDGELAQRVAAFNAGSADFAAAFAPLLNQAPEQRMLQRLQDSIASERPGPSPSLSAAPSRDADSLQESSLSAGITRTLSANSTTSGMAHRLTESRSAAAPLQPGARPQAGYSRRSLIAASVSFLLAGSALGFLARPETAKADENQAIRDLEARYMSLYSAETLADSDSAPGVLQRGLDRTRRNLGLSVSQHQLAVPGAELKMVRILRYDSTAITQIAWQQAAGGPLALCISSDADGSNGAVSNERRHGMQIAWWHGSGYQFALIGRNTPEQLTALAQGLQAALA